MNLHNLINQIDLRALNEGMGSVTSIMSGIYDGINSMFDFFRAVGTLFGG